MPSFEVPFRMTTAMLFFIVAGVAFYYGVEWVARCGFLIFLALGPLNWIRDAIYEVPIGKGNIGKQ